MLLNPATFLRFRFRFRNRNFFSNVAVLLDCKDSKLNSSASNLFAAAKKLSAEFSLIVSTTDESFKVDEFVKENCEILGEKDLKRIVINCGEDGTAEATANYFNNIKFSHLLAIHDSFGKNCLPRIASKVSESVLITDVLKIKKSEMDGSIEFERPIYAGNAIATVQSNRPKSPHFITIRSTYFSSETSKPGGGSLDHLKDKIEVNTTGKTADFKVKLLKREIIKSTRPELGASAKIVVSGGRALKSAENFEKLIYPLADVLGAAVGASRAAVDAGFVPNDLQVGQTGKIVAPQLYIAIGISGAIQHVAGMKDSKVIVAINKDPECPIFQVADYGLVGDLFEIIPELTSKLSK